MASKVPPWLYAISPMGGMIDSIASKKRGGKIRKTGIYRLHKGEHVVPAKRSKKSRKSGRS
jgi:hypothetical protein